MNLKNLMEDKQLDLNRPLLSVRRFSSTTASFESNDQKRKADRLLPKLPYLPAYKSELQSGPVRNPGTVPFVWEQAPGRPKDESKSETCANEQPPIPPKLPPGRALNIKQQAPDKVTKDATAAQSQATKVLSISPKVSNLEKKNAYKCEGSKETTEKQSCSTSEDDDQAYVDAHDTLSRSESLFMNCSISVVSGLYGPDIKPSETFAIDSQTRDFMMNLFLPAAKAMASETSKSAARKQLVVWEQPRQTKQVTERAKQCPLKECRPSVLTDNAPEIGKEESKDEADDYDGSEDLSNKVCGLLPWFCLLNPVPGMRIQPQLPASSVRRVRAKPPYSGSCSEPKDEVRNVVCDQRSVDVQNTSQPYVGLQGLHMPTHKSGNFQPETHKEKGFLGKPEKTNNPMESGIGLQRKGQNNFQQLLANENIERELDSGSSVAEKTLHVDSVNSIRSPPNSSDMKEFTDNSENGILIPERIINIEKTPSDSSLQSIKNLSVVNEKEAVRPEILKGSDSCFIPCSERSTHEIKKPDMSKYLRRDGDLICGPVTKVADKENFNLESKWCGKSSGQENSHGFPKNSTTLLSLKAVDDEKIHLKSKRRLGVSVGESICAWSPDTLKSSTIAHDKKLYSKCQPPIKSGARRSSHGPVQSFNNKAANNQKVDLERGQHLKVGRQQSSDGSYLQMPLALPPLKSPSESWLNRMLPAVSSKNSSSSRSSLVARDYASSYLKTSSLDPKWEMTIRTSNVHHGHLRFTEEHLTSIPEA